MVSAEQFEKMATTLFFHCSPSADDPDSWRRVSDQAKGSWRLVVERQLQAAGVKFERRDPGGEGW